MDEALVIDCDTCPVGHSTACDDCVVGVLLARSGPDVERGSGWATGVAVRWRDQQEPLWR
jgi:hypothetical protein